jgi:glycosyltransferase involved in cell wall biosynthesis
MNKFSAATIILPVLNETYSLRDTVNVIESTCNKDDIAEYIIVVCERTTKEAIVVCEEIRLALNGKCLIHFQKLPFIGGAVREAFELAKGSHVVMMSSDLETDPNIIQQFIMLSKANPDKIITASRWAKGGTFVGYNPVKLLANYVFQKMFSLMYGTTLTDLTYAYRIFPTELVKKIRWEELKHPFFLETVIKPLRLGVKVIEIPAVWKARTEGKSVNPFMNNFAYFKPALRARFAKREHILK